MLDDKTRQPVSVAGVPPDYFSDTGQRWGNPLYRWKEGNALNAETVQLVGDSASAISTGSWTSSASTISGASRRTGRSPPRRKRRYSGTWVKGPGIQFFKKLREETGTPPPHRRGPGRHHPGSGKARDDLDLPGMRILQFAFDFNNKNYYLPHNIDNRNCVLYTGTHDNNTTNGWFYGTEIDENTRRYVLEYLGLEDWSDFHWKLIRQAYRTVANLVIIPAQDILGLRPRVPHEQAGHHRGKLALQAQGGEHHGRYGAPPQEDGTDIRSPAG